MDFNSITIQVSYLFIKVLIHLRNIHVSFTGLFRSDFIAIRPSIFNILVRLDFSFVVSVCNVFLLF